MNCIVTSGTLQLKDWMIIDDTYGRVKQILNQRGEFVESAVPSQPVTIVGLKQLPLNATYFMTVGDEESVSQISYITTFHLYMDINLVNKAF